MEERREQERPQEGRKQEAPEEEMKPMSRMMPVTQETYGGGLYGTDHLQARVRPQTVHLRCGPWLIGFDRCNLRKSSSFVVQSLVH
ncbi:hypothetical protein EJ110_NYTH00886 [Nymphaea thermarum]|nr:hypothetical protein EJ110_NYTH00886 [Nymphaea thermarum]